MTTKRLLQLLLVIGLVAVFSDAYAATRTKEENICWQRCMASDYQDKGLSDRRDACNSDCAGATAESIALPEDPVHRNFGEKTQCLLGCLDSSNYSACVGRCDATEIEKMVVKKYQAVCLPQCSVFRDGDPLFFGRCLIGCDRDLVKKYGVPYCSADQEAEKTAENVFRKSCETQCLEDTGDFASNPVRILEGQDKGISCLVECGSKVEAKRKNCDFVSTGATTPVVETPAPPVSAVKISSVVGKVYVIRANTGNVRPVGWDPNLPPPDTLDYPVTKNMGILKGDKFRSEPGGKMTIRVAAGPGRPGRQVVFSQPVSSRGIPIRFNIISSDVEQEGSPAPNLESGLVIDFGRVRYDASQNRVNTPNTSVSPNGTRYLVTYDEEKNETMVAVLEGSVQVLPVNSALGAVTVSANQELTVTQSTVTPVVALSAESETLLGESPVVSQGVSNITKRAFVILFAVIITMFVLKTFRRS